MQKLIRFSEEISNRVARLAKEQNCSQNAVIESAIKYYLDYRYMADKATMINEEVLRAIDARLALLEQRLNNRANQVLSAVAIEQGVLVQVVAGNLELDGILLQDYRKTAVEHLKANNRVLRLGEVVE